MIGEVDFTTFTVTMQLKAHRDGLKPTTILVAPGKNLGEIAFGGKMQISSFAGMIVKEEVVLDKPYTVAITDDARPTSYVIASDDYGNIFAFWQRWPD